MVDFKRGILFEPIPALYAAGEEQHYGTEFVRPHYLFASLLDDAGPVFAHVA